MKELERIFSAFPGPPDWRIDWPEMEQQTELGVWAQRMKATPQDPVWHGEGDVWTHTKLVCEELARMESFRLLPERQRRELFLAALLHDLGKTCCTRQESGRWVSPHHAAKGSALARNLLWKNWACAGEPEKQVFRETVCLLIRWHTLPPHLGAEGNTERLLYIAAAGELAKDFSLEMLCMLSKADLRGRIAADKRELEEQVEFCRMLAEEQGCLNGPKKFFSDYTRRAFLAGRLAWPDAELYDPTWGQVLMMSGLPGTGKDTWIQQHCAGLPMVSLDALREQMGVLPTDPQGPVIQQAQEQARALLQRRQPFVWNATNLTCSMRERLIRRFENYGAAVRVVFLETSWEEGLQRNQNRPDAVPLGAVEKMLDQLEPPMPWEAQRIEWRCV